MTDVNLGKHLSLQEFCTCTQTYRRYVDQINPLPKNLTETIPALEALCQHIIDPVIDKFGRGRFQLTYGFCSADLKRWLAKKDPVTGQKNGRVSPNLDQHMAHEVNRNGQYYCSRLGAACDFRILDLPSDELVAWILAQKATLRLVVLLRNRAPYPHQLWASAQARHLGLHRQRHSHAQNSLVFEF
jgi:hypothetical protein